ncbi:hypothetical protein M405DRAFT_933957 [Rhizopogon salebrosus TDB-379]|nr:hypothetical protein M405DRAFT_933957 [Rhizopogon salebrosus TDB-379]
MAAKLFGKESEHVIAIFCFVFTFYYMVVIWAAEIKSYFYWAGLLIPSLFTWTASLGKMEGMELANRYTPLAFLARLSPHSGDYASEYEDALALDQLEGSCLFDSSES